jgi:ribonuclease P protein component
LPCDQRLRKVERITEEYEYKTVIRKGRLVWAETFKAYFRAGKGLERKAGFIAGKSVGGASDRNRARRCLKEAYRSLKPRMQAHGFNIVFVARRGAAQAKSSDIRSEMRGMLEKCGVMKKEC